MVERRFGYVDMKRPGWRRGALKWASRLGPRSAIGAVGPRVAWRSPNGGAKTRGWGGRAPSGLVTCVLGEVFGKMDNSVEVQLVFWSW